MAASSSLVERVRAAGLDRDAQVQRAARFRPKQLISAVEATKAAMAYVAHRHRALTAEIGRLDQALADIVADAAPERFLAKQGVGPVVATSLLRTVGDNPGRVRTEAAFCRHVRG